MSEKVVKYIIFDMDGLLLDTERVYTQVTQQIVSRFGKEYTWELKAKLMGTKEMDAAILLVDTLQIPMTPEQYLVERNAGHEKLFPHCKPLPGVVNLIKHLKKHKIPIAVATSSHHKAFLLKTSNNRELFDLFDGHITCGDDPAIQHGKPAPDLFLNAAKKLGHDLKDTSDCLVFEDAPSGVMAAYNAKMRCVWIPDINLELDETLKSKCDLVVHSMENFNPAEFGLPPFDGSN